MVKSFQIAPSLLSADFSRLRDEVLALADAGADALHFDVMDGHYVPNITFAHHVIASLRPHTNLFFDVHLMVSHPDTWIPLVADAGANRITIHMDASPHVHRSLDLIRHCGLFAGVALNPSQSPDMLSYLLDALDFVLVMSVNPGFSGQDFIPCTISKISNLATFIADKPIIIGVDGGISLQNAPFVAKAGASFIVAGKSIFSNPSYAQAINGLRSSLQSSL